jgi:hypothetical protein
MEQPIKRRIVINLDPAANRAARGQKGTGKHRAGRWPAILASLTAFVFVVVAIALVSGYLWWRHYQTTPAYSLALIFDAGQRNDMDAFDKQIDDEAIAKSMVATVGEKAAGRYGLALSGTLQTKIETLVLSLVPKLKKDIHNEVAKEIKEFADTSEPKPFIVVALAVPRFATIDTKGDSAHASATIRDRKIELVMHRYGSLWKVVDFKDDALTERVVDSVMRDLPAIGGLQLSDQSDKLGKPKKKRGVGVAPRRAR